jgi:hypothetical protein
MLTWLISSPAYLTDFTEVLFFNFSISISFFFFRPFLAARETAAGMMSSRPKSVSSSAIPLKSL